MQDAANHVEAFVLHEGQTSASISFDSALADTPPPFRLWATLTKWYSVSVGVGDSAVSFRIDPPGTVNSDITTSLLAIVGPPNAAPAVTIRRMELPGSDPSFTTLVGSDAVGFIGTLTFTVDTISPVLIAIARAAWAQCDPRLRPA